MHGFLEGAAVASRGVVIGLFVGLSMVGGCSGPTPSADQFPANLSITPSTGYSAASAAVVITGTGFLAKVSQPSGGGSPSLDTRHRAWLGTTELAVSWKSTTALEGIVPAGVDPGTYDLTVENALGNRGELKAAYSVLATPVFAGTANVDHQTVNVGQTLTVTFTVTNNGSSAITGFELATPTVSSTDGGSARPTGAAPTPPSTLAPAETRDFVWTYEPTAAGHISITLVASGVDSGSGKPVSAAPPAPLTVNIQQPTTVAATWTVSQNFPAPNQPVTVSLTLTNGSQAATARITSVVPSISPSTGASCTAAQPQASAASPVLIAHGASQSFTWTCRASALGPYNLRAAVTATDDGGASAPVSGLDGISVTCSQQVVVNVAIAGNGSGSVSSMPSGITCSAGSSAGCSAPFGFGTSVTLTAAPGAGATVTWTGCNTASANTCTLNALAATRSVTATFASGTRTLKVSTTGNGTGTVTCNSGACAASYPYGTVVSVAAVPGVGSTFGGWSGSCTGTGACSLAMTANRSVTARFTLSTIHLAVVAVGIGAGTGSVSSSPAGISRCAVGGTGTCGADFNYGTAVTLRATPGVGSTLTWSGCDAVSVNTCNLNALAAARNVTATFARVLLSPAG